MLKDILTNEEINELIKMEDNTQLENIFDNEDLSSRLFDCYRDEIPVSWQNGDDGTSDDWLIEKGLPRDLYYYRKK